MNKTKIGWTDYTWNPSTGCMHGCSYCYARRLAARRYETARGRMFKPEWHEERILEPLKLKRPSKIFVCSMGDLLGNWVPADQIKRVIEVIRATPRHTFQLLTKNPARYAQFEWPENAWLGATVTDQESYRRAIGPLALARGGEVRFVSAEPLLGPIEIGAWRPDWVIAGPMTGPGRVVPPEGAITDLARQCVDLKIPLFVKRAAGLAHPRREFPGVAR